MTPQKLKYIQNFIIDKVIYEPEIMFSDECRGKNDDDIDLVEIIASLYEELHYEVTCEHYQYMFHWANKIGSDVSDSLFSAL